MELCARFFEHARKYYRRPDGTPTQEIPNFRVVLGMLRDLYGSTRANDFGPRALKAVRVKMIERGWTRNNINNQVGRLRMVFRWGVEQEIVNPSVCHGLQAVAGLRRGRTEARESKKVRPVSQAEVDAIRPHVSRQVWAIVQLQLLTAARSGEIIIMRAVDLDISGRVWLYTPDTHKTQYHGHNRTIYLGPRAQAVVRPFLADRPLDAYLFSPREADRERRERQHEKRKTPMSCGNRPGTNRRDDPIRTPGDRYTSASYGRAINRGCKLAGISSWHPHQLRHSAATSLRKEFGLDVARIILGHRSPAITEMYAELDRERALEVMERIG